MYQLETIRPGAQKAMTCQLKRDMQGSEQWATTLPHLLVTMSLVF